MTSSRKALASRGTNSLGKNALAKSFLDGTLDHEIDPPAEERLQEFLQPHVAVEGDPLELDQEIDIAFRARVASGVGAEERQLANSKFAHLVAAYALT